MPFNFDQDYRYSTNVRGLGSDSMVCFLAWLAGTTIGAGFAFNFFSHWLSLPAIVIISCICGLAVLAIVLPWLLKRAKNRADAERTVRSEIREAETQRQIDEMRRSNSYVPRSDP